MLLSLGIVGSAAAVPVVTWWSAPTKPGETLQLFGGDWGEQPRLEYGGRLLKPVKRTETGLWFTLPADLPATTAACRIRSSTGVSKPFAPNAPDVWWAQGEKGTAAVPGGWLRVFGRGLGAGGDGARPGRGALALRDGRGRLWPLAMTLRDTWQLAANVPANVPTGTYALEVRNGLEGTAAATRGPVVEVVAPGEVWKTDRLDVTAFGAIPNDGKDDTFAIRAALEAARKRGGGTVFFPRGRYRLCDTLRIPPHTCLKGAGRNLASLYWPDSDTPPAALLVGEHSFGIEDLFIHSANYLNGLVLDTELAKKHSLTSTRQMVSHDITLRRCKFKFIVDQWYCYSRDLFERRYFQPGNGIDLRDVRNLTVEDCDIYASKEDMTTLYFLVTGENVLMRRCRINGHGWSVTGGNRVIFEENRSLNCTYSISKITRNFYFGRNRQYDLFNNNRESVTHDGSMTAFTERRSAYRHGYTVAGKANGTRVTLTFDAFPEKGNVNQAASFWKGYELQIVDGRGVGQTRTITDIATYAELTIDRPFDIAPDATSRFVICAERRHLLYADNDTEDSSYAIQLYGGVTDCTLARNRCRRAGGFHGEGRDYHGFLPCWGVQFVGNVVEEGNGYRDILNRPVPGDSIVGAVCAYPNMSLTRAYVLRDNVLENNAHFEVTCEDALVENNTVRQADVGIDASRHAATVCCRGNRFEEVPRPFSRRFVAEAGMPEAVAAQRARDAAFLAESLRAGRLLTSEQAREFLGVSVACLPWEHAIRTAIVAEDVRKGALKVVVDAADGLAGASLEIALENAPTEPWHFAKAVTAKLDKTGKPRIDWPYALDAGERGLFSLAVRCTLRMKDGRAFSWLDHLAPFTQNRILKWAIAPGDFPKAGWKRVTGYNPHEAINIRSEFPAAKAGDTVTLRAVLKVTEPVYADFLIEGEGIRAFDARHKPLPGKGLMPHRYEPGTYEINFVKKVSANPRDSNLVKVAFLPFEQPVRPGALALAWPAVVKDAASRKRTP